MASSAGGKKNPAYVVARKCCGRDFTTKCSYRRHNKDVHGDVLSCPWCLQTYRGSRRGEMRSHVQQEHEGRLKQWEKDNPPKSGITLSKTIRRPPLDAAAPTSPSLGDLPTVERCARSTSSPSNTSGSNCSARKSPFRAVADRPYKSVRPNSRESNGRKRANLSAERHSSRKEPYSRKSRQPEKRRYSREDMNGNHNYKDGKHGTDATWMGQRSSDVAYRQMGRDKCQRYLLGQNDRQNDGYPLHRDEHHRGNFQLDTDDRPYNGYLKDARSSCAQTYSNDVCMGNGIFQPNRDFGYNADVTSMPNEVQRDNDRTNYVKGNGTVYDYEHNTDIESSFANQQITAISRQQIISEPVADLSNLHIGNQKCGNPSFSPKSSVCTLNNEGQTKSKDIISSSTNTCDRELHPNEANDNSAAESLCSLLKEKDELSKKIEEERKQKEHMKKEIMAKQLQVQELEAELSLPLPKPTPEKEKPDKLDTPASSDQITIPLQIKPSRKRHGFTFSQFQTCEDRSKGNLFNVKRSTGNRQSNTRPQRSSTNDKTGLSASNSQRSNSTRSLKSRDISATEHDSTLRPKRNRYKSSFSHKSNIRHNQPLQANNIGNYSIQSRSTDKIPFSPTKSDHKQYRDRRNGKLQILHRKKRAHMDSYDTKAACGDFNGMSEKIINTKPIFNHLKLSASKKHDGDEKKPVPGACTDNEPNNGPSIRNRASSESDDNMTMDVSPGGNASLHAKMSTCMDQDSLSLIKAAYSPEKKTDDTRINVTKRNTSGNKARNLPQFEFIDAMNTPMHMMTCTTSPSSARLLDFSPSKSQSLSYSPSNSQSIRLSPSESQSIALSPNSQALSRSPLNSQSLLFTHSRSCSPYEDQSMGISTSNCQPLDFSISKSKLSPSKLPSLGVSTPRPQLETQKEWLPKSFDNTVSKTETDVLHSVMNIPDNIMEMLMLASLQGSHKSHCDNTATSKISEGTLNDRYTVPFVNYSNVSSHATCKEEIPGLDLIGT